MLTLGKSRGLLLRNAGANVGQILVSGVALFVFYRFLLASLGPVRVGIWSLVLAATSASRISDLGFAGSVVKFVARELSREERGRAAAVMETGVIATGAMVGGVALALLPLIAWALPRFITQQALAEAIQILPWSLASMWLGAIGATSQAGLDGSLRADLRALVVTIGNLAFVGLGVLLVRPYGLLGLAWAQVAQGACVAAASWLLLRRQLPGLSILPRCFDIPLLKELIRYGASFQLVSFATMLLDPTTKFMMARFGTLDLVGYFEMANRVVSQLRGIVVGAIQVLVPVIARLHEGARDQVGRVYLKSYRLVWFVALPFFGLIAVAIPLLSWYLNGAPVSSFMVIAELTNLGWGVNILIVPAYFANLGTGDLRWNTISHIVVGVLNILLGFALGMIGGGVGVVAGWSLAFILGTAVLAIGFARTSGVPIGHMLPEGTPVPALLTLLVAALGTIVAAGLGPWSPSWQVALFGLLASVVVMAGVAWWNPERRHFLHILRG